MPLSWFISNCISTKIHFGVREFAVRDVTRIDRLLRVLRKQREECQGIRDDIETSAREVAAGVVYRDDWASRPSDHSWRGRAIGPFPPELTDLIISLLPIISMLMILHGMGWPSTGQLCALRRIDMSDYLLSTAIQSIDDRTPKDARP